MDDVAVQADPQNYGEFKRWINDAAGTYASGAVMSGAGHVLSKVPKNGWLGSFIKSLGDFNLAYAPVDATVNTINRANGWDIQTPTTASAHANKWIQSAGTQAAIGGAMMGAGKLLSMIPHPVGKAGGIALLLAGRLAPMTTAAGLSIVKNAPLLASLGTAGDVFANKLQEKQRQQAQKAQELVKRQQRVQRQATVNNAIGTGIAGLAGLTGAHMLISSIPWLRRKKALKSILYAAATAGAGYAGWKYINGQQRRYNNMLT